MLSGSNFFRSKSELDRIRFHLGTHNNHPSPVSTTRERIFGRVGTKELGSGGNIPGEVATFTNPRWEDLSRTTGRGSSSSLPELVSAITPRAGDLIWFTGHLTDILISDQIAAAIEGFFWPKIFWDFATKTLDAAVKPFPVLQIINLVMGIWVVAWEWPLNFIAGTAIHRSLEARLAFLPLAALAAVLTYQGTNAALYYLVAMVVEFWAFSEGEVCWTCSLTRRSIETNNFTQVICAKPWTLPKRGGGGQAA